MFILQSSHSAIDPWRQIYNNIQMLVKLYIKMFMLNNRIKAEERKVLILIFMLTFKIISLSNITLNENIPSVSLGKL